MVKVVAISQGQCYVMLCYDFLTKSVVQRR